MYIFSEVVANAANIIKSPSAEARLYVYLYFLKDTFESGFYSRKLLAGC